MKNIWMGLIFVAGMGALEAGCKDACQSATDRLVARYKECGVDIANSGPGSAEVVCDSTDGEHLECLASCADSASCDAISVKDTLGAADFSACNADCP